jgi:cytoskeleton protein RodZ
MTSDFDPVSPEVNHSSPGKLLRDAREQLGLTQEQVAKDLFMTLTKVKAIEADQYTRLHSDTFIRGYLRAYAQLVKVDVVSLMLIYDGQAKILGLKENFVPVKQKQDSSNKKIWQFALLVGGILLLMWLVSIWFLDNRKENDYSNINVAVPSKTLSFVSTSSSPASVQNVSNGSVASVADTNASVSVSSQAKIDVTTRSPSVSTGSDKLDFYFRDECWVEVSDANGDVLVTELQMKDTQLTLKGQSPFEIKLGNAPSVSLKLNDENVALVPALGTNVLMLKVGHKSGT